MLQLEQPIALSRPAARAWRLLEAKDVFVGAAAHGQHGSADLFGSLFHGPLLAEFFQCAVFVTHFAAQCVDVAPSCVQLGDEFLLGPPLLGRWPALRMACGFALGLFARGYRTGVGLNRLFCAGPEKRGSLNQ